MRQAWQAKLSHLTLILCTLFYSFKPDSIAMQEVVQIVQCNPLSPVSAMYF